MEFLNYFVASITDVGYCGKQYSKTDNVVAMPKDFFDTGPCNTVGFIRGFCLGL